MPKTAKPQDFKHRVHKVGKHKLAPANVTNTSFKWATIKVGAGAKSPDEAASESTATARLHAALAATAHHNVSTRKGALESVLGLLAADAGLAIGAAAPLVSCLAPRLVDAEQPLRYVALEALAAVLGALPHAAVAPFVPTVAAYLRSGLTSLHASVRLEGGIAATLRLAPLLMAGPAGAGSGPRDALLALGPALGALLGPAQHTLVVVTWAPCHVHLEGQGSSGSLGAPLSEAALAALPPLAAGVRHLLRRVATQEARLMAALALRALLQSPSSTSASADSTFNGRSSQHRWAHLLVPSEPPRIALTADIDVFEGWAHSGQGFSNSAGSPSTSDNVTYLKPLILLWRELQAVWEPAQPSEVLAYRLAALASTLRLAILALGPPATAGAYYLDCSSFEAHRSELAACQAALVAALPLEAADGSTTTFGTLSSTSSASFAVRLANLAISEAAVATIDFSALDEARLVAAAYGMALPLSAGDEPTSAGEDAASRNPFQLLAPVRPAGATSTETASVMPPLTQVEESATIGQRAGSKRRRPAEPPSQHAPAGGGILAAPAPTAPAVPITRDVSKHARALSDVAALIIQGLSDAAQDDANKGGDVLPRRLRLFRAILPHTSTHIQQQLLAGFAAVFAKYTKAHQKGSGIRVTPETAACIDVVEYLLRADPRPGEAGSASAALRLMLPDGVVESWLAAFPRLLWAAGKAVAPAQEGAGLTDAMLRVLLAQARTALPMSPRHIVLRGTVVRQLVPLFFATPTAATASNNSAGPVSSLDAAVASPATGSFGPFVTSYTPSQRERLLWVLQSVGGLTPTLRRALCCALRAPSAIVAHTQVSDTLAEADTTVAYQYRAVLAQTALAMTHSEAGDQHGALACVAFILSAMLGRTVEPSVVTGGSSGGAGPRLISAALLPVDAAVTRIPEDTPSAEPSRWGVGQLYGNEEEADADYFSLLSALCDAVRCVSLSASFDGQLPVFVSSVAAFIHTLGTPLADEPLSRRTAAMLIALHCFLSPHLAAIGSPTIEMAALVSGIALSFASVVYWGLKAQRSAQAIAYSGAVTPVRLAPASFPAFIFSDARTGLHFSVDVLRKSHLLLSSLRR